MPVQFKRAVKHEAQGRVAIVGPAGSGKSYTSLRLARKLAGPTGKIAAIDTEHGSLSKYADLFDFDVFELGSYSPSNFIDALDEAEKQQYSVFIVDSLSHFWAGKDGALEFVDMAAKRHKDNMGGWKEFRPHEREMVDRMIASKCHVIVTMRTKTEYKDEEYTNARGERKTKRVKVGLQPVQRDGLEYEMDLVAYMDEENTFIVEKTRCPYYTKKAFTQPTPDDFTPFQEWLKGAAPAAKPAPAISKAVAPASAPSAHTDAPATRHPHDAAPSHIDPQLKAMLQRIEQAGDQLTKAFGQPGHSQYMEVLGNHGAESVHEIASLEQASVICNDLVSTYKSMAHAKKEAVA